MPLSKTLAEQLLRQPNLGFSRIPSQNGPGQGRTARARRQARTLAPVHRLGVGAHRRQQRAFSASSASGVAGSTVACPLGRETRTFVSPGVAAALKARAVHACCLAASGLQVEGMSCLGLMCQPVGGLSLARRIRSLWRGSRGQAAISESRARTLAARSSSWTCRSLVSASGGCV